MEEKYDATQQYLDEGKPIKDEGEEQYYQDADPVIPVKEEFPGPHNFQVSLANQDSSKHWVVSIETKTY